MTLVKTRHAHGAMCVYQVADDAPPTYEAVTGGKLVARQLGSGWFVVGETTSRAATPTEAMVFGAMPTLVLPQPTGGPVVGKQSDARLALRLLTDYARAATGGMGDATEQAEHREEVEAAAKLLGEMLGKGAP